LLLRCVQKYINTYTLLQFGRLQQLHLLANSIIYPLGNAGMPSGSSSLATRWPGQRPAGEQQRQSRCPGHRGTAMLAVVSIGRDGGRWICYLLRWCIIVVVIELGKDHLVALEAEEQTPPAPPPQAGQVYRLGAPLLLLGQDGSCALLPSSSRPVRAMMTCSKGKDKR
jgi:hypothetical protein